MTNKQTIDGVSRELRPCPFCGSTPSLPDGYGTQYEIGCNECGQAISSVQICDLMTIEERVADEFKDYRYGEEFIERAKLVAIESWNSRLDQSTAHPKGEVEPVAFLDIGAGGYVDMGSDLTNEQLEKLPFGRHKLVISGTYGINGFLPSTEAQNEVERLRYKAELYDEVWDLATGLGYMNVTEAIGTLRAQLAERDVLLRELLEYAELGWDVIPDISVRVRFALSTSAEPKPRGEAVEWAYCPECGCEEIHHQQGRHKQCAECHQEWFSDIDYSDVVRGHLEKLKAEQPAPVASGTTSNKYKAELYDEVWQKARDMGFANVTDALNEVAKLNGLKP